DGDGALGGPNNASLITKDVIMSSEIGLGMRMNDSQRVNNGGGFVGTWKQSLALGQSLTCSCRHCCR
ncbi:hypothetical protein BDN70DRAFT_886706, partial [Pholiota conissans]